MVAQAFKLSTQAEKERSPGAQDQPHLHINSRPARAHFGGWGDSSADKCILQKHEDKLKFPESKEKPDRYNVCL